MTQLWEGAEPADLGARRASRACQLCDPKSVIEAYLTSVVLFAEMV